jgi:arylformamidase
MNAGPAAGALFDISLPIAEDMAVWPGDPPPVQRWLQRLADGDDLDLSQWTLGAHTGTHLDAPSHFVAGAPDVEALGLDALVGACLVVDVAAGSLPATDTRHPRLLLKHSAGIGADLAEHLIARGVRLVGVDSLSIESAEAVEAGAPTHRALLAAGIAILEGLVLEAVPPGEYFLVALPLRLQHTEASPVRAILFRREVPPPGARPNV